MTKEEQQGAFILVGLTALVLGYKFGYHKGKQDLLHAFLCAQRITHKEQ